MADAEVQVDPPHHPVGFNLAAIAVVLALGGVGVAYLVDNAARDGRTEMHPLDGEIVLTRSLGGVDLQIPLSWFRYEEQPIEGLAKQVELRLDLPLGAEGRRESIDVTLVPRSRARPSAMLLDGVYLHQFVDEHLSGPLGLVGKPLRPTGGYSDEAVWFDPLSTDPFVAKCAPLMPEGPSQCLRTVYLGPGIAAIYAFAESALSHWREFDPAVEAKLRQIGAL